MKKVNQPKSFEQVVNEMVDKVKAHTDWPHEKVMLWFRTPNPNLGGASPDDMLLRGRAHKLSQFIDSRIDEDTRKD